MAWSEITALRLAYLGWNYHGVVKQKDLLTVESVLTEALADQGIRAKLRFTSRTDKGVSAIDNIAFYRGPPPNVAILNERLPMDVTVWATARTEEPPRPTMRVYLYTVPFKLRDATESLSRAMEELNQSEAYTIKNFDVITGDNFTYIRIYGKSFKRNEIRKLIGLTIELSTGRRIGLAPPEGLILVRTVTDLKWREASKRKLFLMRKMIERNFWRLESSRLLYELLSITSSWLL
ncbi:MAG: hypothetical protein NZ992_03355 [Candidatus Korarchaeum sp.]|nr:hypothetical protein [Candidatus Korarchaeum sp.]MDW8035898.1 hypothetical protein [Candidatus Korarchaeum sp.]